jgi:hypothetical protein
MALFGIGLGLRVVRERERAIVHGERSIESVKLNLTHVHHPGEQRLGLGVKVVRFRVRREGR